MSIRFLEPAREELAEAAAWYNARNEGRGDQFVREVQDGVAKILERPMTWPVVRGEIRKYRVRHFPYGVVYAIVG